MNPESREHHMATPEAFADPHSCLSALADGEAGALGEACALWRNDCSARARWHAYHLIGDVLRSDELASPPGRDAAFLDGLRERLAREPVPLVPVAAAAHGVAGPTEARSRLGWRAPAAVAAGFVAVAVAGVLVLLQRPADNAPAAAAPSLAAAPADRPALPATAPAARESRLAAASPVEPRLVLSGGLLRDPGLDAYLRAHQAARGALPAALPGGALRNVDMIMTPGMPAAAGGPGASRGQGAGVPLPAPALRPLASGAAR
jgi:sigma-E factor negative regulatory protein RseA